ncbi:MAG TPA: magnesium/cobalt transporter CorA [Candidatus Nanoarchaeia archaeon]|nr:magnesium/cobalt transporter CorA [Candidatus Nanoarchaeia archaeon]
MIDVHYFDKTVKKGSIGDLKRLKGKQLWVDVTNLTKKEAELLKKIFGIHPLTLEDLSKTHTRIKVEEFPNYLFCVFYGIKDIENGELEELDFILGEKFIITNHYHGIAAYEELKSNKDRLEELFKEGNDFVFHHLLDTQIDNYFPVLDVLDDEVENIEEEVTKGVNPAIVKKILEMKRHLILIKKAALPQREKLSYLLLKGSRHISRKAEPYFRDLYDHSIRVCDSVDNHREAITSAFEVYMSAVNNSTNDIMKMLSVVATIALPLTVISSIYGTNFKILPGAEFPYGFWLMIVLMLLISGVMFHYFLKRGWVKIVK